MLRNSQRSQCHGQDHLIFDARVLIQSMHYKQTSPRSSYVSSSSSSSTHQRKSKINFRLLSPMQHHGRFEFHFPKNRNLVLERRRGAGRKERAPEKREALPCAVSDLSFLRLNQSASEEGGGGEGRREHHLPTRGETIYLSPYQCLTNPPARLR